MKVAEKLVDDCNLVVEAREAFVEPVVVRRPCGVDELVDTAVGPVRTDECFVGTEFLKVPELTCVDTSSAVVNCNTAFKYKTAVDTGKFSVEFFGSGDFCFCRRILGSHIKVTHTRNESGR